MKPRNASRLAASIGTVSIALMLGGLVLMFIDRHARLPAGTSGTWALSNVLEDAVNIPVSIIGIVLASRRPGNRLGWLFLTAGAGLGLQKFTTAYGLHSLVADPGSLPAGRAMAWVSNWIWAIPITMLCFLFLLFPTGQLPSRRWRPVGWLVVGAFTLAASDAIVAATQSWKHPFNPSSTGSGGVLGFVLLVPIIGAIVLSLAGVVVRFRRSVGEERLQLKWFVTGAVLVVVTLVMSIFWVNTPPLLSVLQSLAFVLLWAAIAIAVLKYRLYEIDVVISKAALYGTLAVFITIVYVGLVVGVGSLVGNRRSPLLSALAAAVIAVAFQPVRHRAGRLANRMVYGKRATPYEVLSDFADRMAGTYSIDDIMPRTAALLAEGTGAVRADVWLRVGGELRAEGSWPSVTQVERVPLLDGTIQIPGATRAVPVRHQGELLGALSVHKAPADPITPAEDKLLTDVASQAGLVLRNVLLIEDLRASRQRIVAAQDAAARRLERNIHDGAQQQLVALAIKANLAESMVGRDEEKERALLAQLKAEAQDALENLRDLARGIYPALLADQGLVAALTSQARKSPLPVSVESEGVGRFPQEVEAAVYFCALEALQNVAKYARASEACVRVHHHNGHLAFDVSDDGVGFDPTARGYGTGMQGMADRLAALGGELTVTSSRGQGTTVSGRVPVVAHEPAAFRGIRSLRPPPIASTHAKATSEVVGEDGEAGS